ncbi:eukaryotic translation initiation factor 4E type 2 isoform X2 [Pantherophis guttatus]|uniref:Eukaryotic translation initiation factor 4E type 2 isoform X2 n=1 Tax=Pantherophis guttatus TaxID=94885 RepID=A0ABM3YXS3_PANGU|nr:eukaryotic translation initiation factor 4E type 2 isoform X2 [Pantherophis guttatus]
MTTVAIMTRMKRTAHRKMVRRKKTIKTNPKTAPRGRLRFQDRLSTLCSITTPSGTPDGHREDPPALRVTNRTSSKLAPLPLTMPTRTGASGLSACERASHLGAGRTSFWPCWENNLWWGKKSAGPSSPSVSRRTSSPYGTRRPATRPPQPGSGTPYDESSTFPPTPSWSTKRTRTASRITPASETPRLHCDKEVRMHYQPAPPRSGLETEGRRLPRRPAVKVCGTAWTLDPSRRPLHPCQRLTFRQTRDLPGRAGKLSSAFLGILPTRLLSGQLLLLRAHVCPEGFQYYEGLCCGRGCRRIGTPSSANKPLGSYLVVVLLLLASCL